MAGYPVLSSDVPAQFCFRHCKGDIRKAGLAFEPGSNGKAQEDVKRDMTVIPGFIRQGLCERSCKSLFSSQEGCHLSGWEMTFLLHLFFQCGLLQIPFLYLFGISVL